MTETFCIVTCKQDIPHKFNAYHATRWRLLLHLNYGFHQETIQGPGLEFQNKPEFPWTPCIWCGLFDRSRGCSGASGNLIWLWESFLFCCSDRGASICFSFSAILSASELKKHVLSYQIIRHEKRRWHAVAVCRIFPGLRKFFGNILPIIDSLAAGICGNFIQ